MEAVIFIGIQATGKSAFFQQQFFAKHVRGAFYEPRNIGRTGTRNAEYSV